MIAEDGENQITATTWHGVAFCRDDDAPIRLVQQGQAVSTAFRPLSRAAGLLSDPPATLVMAGTARSI